MKQLYIKTNAAVLIYIVAFVLLLAIIVGLGFRGYLRSKYLPPPFYDNLDLGPIETTSGQIIRIGAASIIINAIDVSKLKSFAPSVPAELPRKEVEVFIDAGTKFLKQKYIPPDFAPTGGTSPRDNDFTGGIPPSPEDFYEEISLADFKVGDAVSVLAPYDIRGLDSFTATQVFLVETGVPEGAAQ